jgi:hypothetical protein
MFEPYPMAIRAKQIHPKKPALTIDEANGEGAADRKPIAPEVSS